MKRRKELSQWLRAREGLTGEREVVRLKNGEDLVNGRGCDDDLGEGSGDEVRGKLAEEASDEIFVGRKGDGA